MSSEYWFPWYPEAYEGDAGHLDHVADSCYRRLIDWYMRKREPIPKDPVRLMHITRTTPPQFQAVWPQIEGFFTLVDGFLHLKRCNIELDRQDHFKRKQSHAGAKSAEKRSQQLQLLADHRSTPVQPAFNHIQEGTGENIHNNTNSKGTNGDGHAHGNGPGNGSQINLNPLGASRSFRNGALTKEAKHELYEARTLRFVRIHHSIDAADELVRLQLSDDPSDKPKRKAAFNAADADYQRRKTSGTLDPRMNE